MSDRRRRRDDTEGRAHARERWRQERDRAAVDRALREDTDPEAVVEVGDGAEVRVTPGPQEIGGLLGDLVRARGWEQRLRGTRLHDRWEAIVGPELAQRSRPGRLEGGVLQVVVSSPGWAAQLRYMTDQVAGRVAAETGITVRQVVVVVGALDD